MKKPFSRFKQTAVLILVLGALVAGLAYQQKVLFKGNRPSLAKQFQDTFMDLMGAKRKRDPKELAQSTTPSKQPTVEQIDQPLLEEARAGSVRFVQLLKERQTAIQWPDLTVPTPDKMRTNKESEEEYLRYRLRELDAYQRLTKDSGEIKVAGEKFLDAYLRNATWKGKVGREEITALGDAALKAGSHDPLLRGYYAQMRWYAGDDSKGLIAIWDEVLKELPSTKYPAIVQANLHCYLIEEFQSDRFSNVTPRIPPLVSATVAWLEEEADRPELLPVVCHRLWSLWNGMFKHYHEPMVKAFLQSPKIDHYIKHALAGNYFNEVGWYYRGGDFFDKIPETQRDQFLKYLQIAATHLQFAWTLHPELPYPQTKLLSISMTDPSIPGERPYFWFVQAVEAQFDYYDAYSSMSMALLPRWGGSIDQSERFARSCMNTNRFETFVPYYALEGLNFVVEWENVSLPQSRRAVKILKEFTAKRIAFRKKHPDIELYDKGGTYDAQLCQMLEECDMSDLAADEIRAIGKNMNWTLMRKLGRPGRYLALRLLAARGEDRKWVLELDEALRQPWDPSKDEELVDGLETQVHHLKDGAPKDDASLLEYFHHLDAIVSQLREFSKGEWAPLPITDELIGFEPYCDGWYVSTDQKVTLSGRAQDAPQICLRPLANFQPPLEVEAKLELLDPVPYPQFAGIGWSREGMKFYSDCLPTQPIFGIGANQMPTFLLQTKSRGDVAWMKLGSMIPLAHHQLDTTKAHQLRLKLWPNRGEYRVDNRVWMALHLPEGLHPQGWLCFGSNLPEWDGAQGINKGSMRWNDLRVRRLNIDSPPVDSEPIEQRAEYWEHRQNLEPEDPVVAAELCKVRYEQHRFDDVIQVANQTLSRMPKINGLSRWKAMALLDGKHDYAQAFKEFELAAQEFSDDFDVYAGMIEILAAAPEPSLRNGARAKQMGETFARGAATFCPRLVAAYAAAHAELGDFDAAIHAQQQVLNAADEVQAKDWNQRLQLYMARQSFRLPTGDVKD